MSTAHKTQVVVLLPLKKETISTLREEFPKVEFHHIPDKGIDEISKQVLEKAEIIFTRMVLPKAEDVPNLKWLHFFLTVVDVRKLDDALLEINGLSITTNSGVTAPAYADIALMQIFSLGYHLTQVCTAKETHKYDLQEGKYPAARLYDSTIGIIGYGSVGREIARITHAFGVECLAVKRDLMHPEDDGFALPEHGDPHGDYFTRLYPPQAIPSMAKECDFVLVTVPFTNETEKMISAEVFVQMKPTSFLINLSAPGVVDLDALENALSNRLISGAAFVQFADYAFEEDCPLWNMDKVLIFPPFSSLIRNEEEKAVLLLIENIKQYLNGGPLTNRIDIERGY
jgi:phosphoglycerate dehydrogenase-like enzyme